MLKEYVNKTIYVADEVEADKQEQKNKVRLRQDAEADKIKLEATIQDYVDTYNKYKETYDNIVIYNESRPGHRVDKSTNTVYKNDVEVKTQTKKLQKEYHDMKLYSDLYKDATGTPLISGTGLKRKVREYKKGINF